MQRLIIEGLLIVFKGEATPGNITLTVVEAEGDEGQDREVQEQKSSRQDQLHPPSTAIVERVVQTMLDGGPHHITILSSWRLA